MFKAPQLLILIFQHKISIWICPIPNHSSHYELDVPILELYMNGIS